ERPRGALAMGILIRAVSKAADQRKTAELGKLHRNSAATARTQQKAGKTNQGAGRQLASEHAASLLQQGVQITGLFAFRPPFSSGLTQNICVLSKITEAPEEIGR